MGFGFLELFFQTHLILRTFFQRTFTAKFFYQKFLCGLPLRNVLRWIFEEKWEHPIISNLFTLLNLMLLSFIHTSVQSTLWQRYGHGTKRKMCNCTLYTEIQIGMKIVHLFSRPGRLWRVATLVFFSFSFLRTIMFQII